MTNPFINNPFFSLSNGSKNYELQKSDASVGDLVTVSWRIEGLETEIESVIGYLESIDSNCIIVNGEQIPNSQIHSVKINRTALKPEEKTEHDEIVASIVEGGDDQETSFDSIWDDPSNLKADSGHVEALDDVAGEPSYDNDENPFG